MMCGPENGFMLTFMTKDFASLGTGARIGAIARGEAPPLVHRAAVAAVGTGDVPALMNDPNAAPLVAALKRQDVAQFLLQHGAPEVQPNQLLPVGDAEDDTAPTWVAEGSAIPMARFSSTSTFAPATMQSSLLAFQRDLDVLLGARANGYRLGRTSRALVKGGDYLLDDQAASSSRAAGLLFGRTAMGSGSPGNLTDDIELLVANVSDGAPVAPVWFVSPRGAAFLATSGVEAFRDLGLKGGTLLGAPALTVPAAGSALILVDAAQIGVADLGFEVLSSDVASVQLDDNPEGNSAVPTAGTTRIVSAFQLGLNVVRVNRFLSWALLRTDAAQFLALPFVGSPA